MTKAANRNRWTTPSLGGLLTATVVVLGATAYSVFFLQVGSSYMALITGAWTTLVAYWTIFFVQTIRRRQKT